MGWDSPKKRKKNFSPEFRLHSTQVRKFRKKYQRSKKKLKKNPFPALFLAKTGLDKPRMRKKKFSPEFRSYSTRARNLKKNSLKIQKIKKTLTGIIFSQNGMRFAEKERKTF